RPRIPARTVVARRRRSSHRELVEVRFADEDRTRAGEPPRDFGILGRHAIVEYGACSRRADARGVDIVLEGNRDPVQRAAELAGTLLGIEQLRLGQRAVAGDGDERVDFWIVDVDAREAGAYKIRRCHAPGPDPRRSLSERER